MVGKTQRLRKVERRRLRIDLGHHRGLDFHRPRLKENGSDHHDSRDESEEDAGESERLSHRREGSIGFRHAYDTSELAPRSRALPPGARYGPTLEEWEAYKSSRVGN
jgi:hypothetical protein